jgi:cytochrome o ubiquinol oxidase subunit II
MKKKHKYTFFIIGCLAIIGAVFAVYFVLRHENALLTHPKGIIAQKELALLYKSYLLMLIIIVPTFVLLFVIALKYHAKNTKAKYTPDKTDTKLQAILLWAAPSAIIAVMGVMLYKATHELDPYNPLKSDVQPLHIQVVALDWKWLFIYPEQGIATLNFFAFPEQTPIHLTLAADGSPMNSFWLPQLTGQIYAMTGMTTQLHFMADGPGIYSGRAAEINGRGFADMTFIAQSETESDFLSWIDEVKQSPIQLSESVYNELLPPSINNGIILYSHVEENFFNQIVDKYMAHGK